MYAKKVILLIHVVSFIINILTEKHDEDATSEPGSYFSNMETRRSSWSRAASKDRAYHALPTGLAS